MKKTILLTVFCLTCVLVHAQRFSFLPEVGFARTQMDGDKLQGYDKTGLLLGIGTHYALAQDFNLAVKTTFYRLGSARRDRFQDKLEEGLQLEMGLSTIGLELSLMYAPIEKSFFLGFGVVHHRILDFDYNIVDNVIGGPPRILESESLASSFNNLKVFIGWSFAKSYRFTIAYESGFTDILQEDFFNISRLRPYHLAFTLSYELNPVERKKKKQKKTRGERRKR